MNELYALINYPEFQRNMKLLRIYLEGMEISYSFYQQQDLEPEVLEDLKMQIEAVRTIYKGFSFSLENPHSGPTDDDNIN